ncbi:MAG: DUF92 domain-containing protein, partial [Catalinimonas sp.]
MWSATLPPLALPDPFVWVVVALTAAAVLAWTTRRMDAAGAAVGWGLSVSILLGCGPQGVVWLMIFFVLGTSASRYRLGLKERSGLAEARGGRR